MTEWKEPIIDRTASDVSYAKEHQSNSEANKGAINYTDLNRVEDNYKYILEQLAKDSIYIDHKYRNFTETEFALSENQNVVPVENTYTDWQEQNLPWLSEINRIRTNYNNLVSSFLVGLGLPILNKTQFLGYEEVNDWERISYTAKKMSENMQSEFIYCGTIDSGGERLL